MQFPRFLNNSLLCALLLFFQCSDEKKGVNIQNTIVYRPEPIKLNIVSLTEVQNVLSTFIPDTSINFKYYLRSAESFDSSNISPVVVDDGQEFPVAYFCNKGLSEYIKAFQYNGDKKNDFSVFEIKPFDKNIRDKSFIQLSDSSFKTNGGIYLGMSLDSLIKIKGNNYLINAPQNSDTILSYNVTNYKTSPFLKRNKMPSYFFKCSIRNSKIKSIIFGFDYP